MLHLFSCCTLFMLQFFMLHFFRFGSSLLTWFLFFSYNGALFSSQCALLHYILSCHTRLMLHLLSLALFSCCILSIMHSPTAIFHAVLISCCGLFRLHFFKLRFFHVAVYQVVLSSSNIPFFCIAFYQFSYSSFSPSPSNK